MDRLKRKLESQTMSFLLPLAKAVELDVPRRPRKSQVVDAFLRDSRALPSKWLDLIEEHSGVDRAIDLQAAVFDQVGEPEALGEDGNGARDEGETFAVHHILPDRRPCHSDDHGGPHSPPLLPTTASNRPATHPHLPPTIPKWHIIKSLNREEAQRLLAQLKAYDKPSASRRTLRELQKRAREGPKSSESPDPILDSNKSPGHTSAASAGPAGALQQPTQPLWT